MQRKKKILFCTVAVMMLLSMAGCESAGEKVRDETLTLQEAADDQEETEKKENVSENQGTEDKMIIVHVCGKVRKEGVVTLPAGIRIYQAIEMAGGMTDEAASSCLNLAEVLTDGARVYVPGKEEVEQGKFLPGDGGGTNSTFSENKEEKVNINRASKEELMTLSGIGEFRAEAILQYRTEHGTFASIEDLKNVSGIKDGIYEKIKDKITV